MCRIALMNKQGEKEIEKIYGLDKYLKYLEKQLGGHGNGFALMKNNEVIKFRKGINLDVRDIAEQLRNTDYDWCIFHTRLASMGVRSDNNCHPFKRKNTVLAMNGTERGVSFVSEPKGITDTEAILDLITKYNLGITALTHFSSIFMGFFNGRPFVVAGNTSNIKILKNKRTGALVFASCFPAKFRNNIYESQKCFVWSGGNLPNTLIKSKNTYSSAITFNDYLYHQDLYAQCYFDNVRGGTLHDIPV